MLRRSVLLVAALAGAGLLAGCGGGQSAPHSPAPRQTVIVGIDALDWQVVDPLLDAGKLPTLAALRAQSTSGINLSFVPLEKSPLIWASMATGLEPEQHGVGGFLKGHGEDYEALASSADWRAPAIWDIAGAAGLRSCVIGWWVTYPARDIDGVLVSDHVTYTELGSRNPDAMVRPASLTAALDSLTVDYRDVPLDLLRALLPGATEAQLVDVDNRQLRELRVVLAGDLTYLATARLLAARGHFDLFAVYFRGLDLMCHKFWQFMDPADGTPASDAEVALLGHVVPGYLTLLDGWLTEVVSWFPADVNLVVVSDHGFHGPRRDRAGNLRKGVAEHRPEGFLMIRSRLYEPGASCDRSFVMNVAPTVLALLGLPPSLEMPGRVLREGLTPEGLRYVEHLEQHRIASYESLAPAPPPEVAADPALDEAVKKQLRSLGYVD
ncbi:MAG: alkaline phosphatase family protein [Candidatus Krumholzibacteriia bacterium]